MLKAPSSSIPKDYDSLKGDYIELAEKLTFAKSENESLKQQVAWFKKQAFGTKSERLLEPHQMAFEEIEEPGKPAPVSEPETKEEKVVVKRSKPGKKPLPKDLPRKQVIHIPPEVKGHEDEFVKIGEEINEELNFIPAKMEVIEHVYPKFKAKADNTIHQAACISRPIPKGRPGPGLLAYVLTSKWCDHLPLDRMVKIFKRQKIDIPKSTMVLWVTRCHELLFPIYEKIKEQIISGGYVLADETPVQVLDRNKKGSSHRGYLWTYGDLKQVIYDYREGRSREGPHKFLKDFSGFLQTDGYAAYNDIPTTGSITRLGCLAHARRKFFDIKDFESELTKTPLKLIGTLYEIERSYSDERLSFDERKLRAEAVLSELKNWLDDTIKNVLPSSAIAKAINYSLGQWEKLTVYHTEPFLKIDNNFSERCIKSAVIGRKNWMFFGSHEGGKRSATIYSLVESCKLQGIDPWEYFNDILSRLDEAPMKIENLTPVNWKKKERV